MFIRLLRIFSRLLCYNQIRDILIAKVLFLSYFFWQRPPTSDRFLQRSYVYLRLSPQDRDICLHH